MLFSYIKRGIYVIKRTRFAVAKLVGKMHPLLR